MELFRSWLSSVEQEATRRLFQGLPVPTKKLVLTTKYRRWTNEKRVARRLARIGLDEDQFSPRKLISPAAVETLLKRHKLKDHWGKVAEYVERPPGTPVMADENDSRPEYTPGSEFGVIED